MKDNITLPDGLLGLCAVAQFYRIPTDPFLLLKELAAPVDTFGEEEIVRAAKHVGMKARIITSVTEKRLHAFPLPAIARLKDGRYCVITDRNSKNVFRLFYPRENKVTDVTLGELFAQIDNQVVLIQRRLLGKGKTPGGFSLSWFIPTIVRYKKPIRHIIVASFFIQLFALVTPLFFQVIIDKVLVHKSYSTLIVITAGLIIIHTFDVVLRYLRTYVLSHTANRIDVELGSRLFSHLFSLPIRYFETRNAGSTVARIKELENIRNFFTGQAIFSVIDLLFIFVFIFVLFFYSSFLTLITLLSIPCYIVISCVLHPLIKKKINEKFLRSSANQQFIVESVVGAQTIKASAVEPVFKQKWEENMAAYVRASFDATQTVAIGQNTILFINKIFSVLILFFGAGSVINATLSVGGLIAFNMISGQVVQPILRISQLWQDFQQVQVSVERLGDIVDVSPEFTRKQQGELPAIKGNIHFENVSFAYKPLSPPVLKNISLNINSGEVIGIVGASGSGKSTLTKLMQRLWLPGEGKIYIDGTDIINTNPSWLRNHIGVVLQENILFNATIHENIAFARPGLSRAKVTAVAKLAGADEFIRNLPLGYDTVVEERGGNLSGGQRQRIAISRALACDPPVLILDEATSALDYESEHIIRQNMQYMVQGRTVIIIAHRLSTVRHCDRIISMADGCIIEEGTHNELLANSGIYANLWALQTADDVSLPDEQGGTV